MKQLSDFPITTACCGHEVGHHSQRGCQMPGCACTVSHHDEEFAALCPTCGGLPTDYHEMTKMRAALKEALERWKEYVDSPGEWEAKQLAEDKKRIAAMWKEFGM